MSNQEKRATKLGGLIGFEEAAVEMVQSLELGSRPGKDSIATRRELEEVTAVFQNWESEKGDENLYWILEYFFRVRLLTLRESEGMLDKCLELCESTLAQIADGESVHSTTRVFEAVALFELATSVAVYATNHLFIKIHKVPLFVSAYQDLSAAIESSLSAHLRGSTKDMLDKRYQKFCAVLGVGD